jgi:hypothetical protein
MDVHQVMTNNASSCASSSSHARMDVSIQKQQEQGETVSLSDIHIAKPTRSAMQQPCINEGIKLF